MAHLHTGRIDQVLFDATGIELEKLDPAEKQIKDWAEEGMAEEQIAARAKFLTGVAGSGKTYKVREAMKKDPNKAILAATTGIAAINLGQGVTTIHSLLRFFDLASLKDSFHSRKLHRHMKALVEKGLRWIIIDEASMLSGTMLDYLYRAATHINSLQETQEKGGFGLFLVGDFCQLPPIDKRPDSKFPDYAFMADCWGEFEKNTTKLTKIYRQSDPLFLQALNAARRGDGKTTIECLKEIEGVQWGMSTIENWKGTTLFPKNNLVDDYNWARLRALPGEYITVKSKRWGQCPREWKNIPEESKFKKEAYIMILSNDTQGWEYANGSCGIIKEFNGKEGEEGFLIELTNGKRVVIEEITRQNRSSEKPLDELVEIEIMSKSEWKKAYGDDIALEATSKAQEAYLLENGWKEYCFQKTVESMKVNREKLGSHAPYYDFEEEKWILGEITYFPIRLAYATTVHKSQGLTLDMLQVDFNNKFFGEPSMGYVALSRVKSPEGLRLIGSERLIESRINVSSKVERFL